MLFAFAMTIFNVSASADCDDSGVCQLPGTSGEHELAVLSPVGSSSIKNIKQAPRLSTLKGKRIAIVGGSFMASVTHPELKRLILKDYPDVKIYVLKEIGSAGPWPGPGVIRQQKDEFIRKLKELRIDAVISGNGGCGLCTPKEMGSCIAAEHSGIPSVMIAAPGFSEQSGKVARVAGVAIPRIAIYPGAFSAHTREELLKNTRDVLYPQIIKALCTPFSDEETCNAQKSDTESQFACKGSLDEINLYFTQNGWTDGLPIIPPTEARVAEFLKYTDYAPDAVIAEIPPSYRKATAKLIAVNGVMSGCPPEYMPILIAFTKAMTDGDFRRTLASTHAWTPYCILNGPLARQLELDCGQGEISNIRNAKIGRFINLAMLNLGGYHIKENRMGTFGYLMPWCLVEDDAMAVKLNWRPYHMQQCFNLNDNVLTAASALCWGNNLAPATAKPQKIMELMAQDAVEKQQFAIGSGTPFVYRSMLITGNVAKDLAKEYKSKESLEQALINTARQPLASRTYSNYWANPGSSFNENSYSIRRHSYVIARKENAKQTAAPAWLEWIGVKTMETVPVMQAGKTAIIITGDANRNKTMCVPGGGFTSVKIELPANWDELMEKAGYKPLKSFYLKSDLVPSSKTQQFKNYRQRRNNNRTNRY